MGARSVGGWGLALWLVTSSLALAVGKPGVAKRQAPPSSPAASAPVLQEATGEAVIVEGNEPRAEREARERALRSAVEQVVGIRLTAETLTRNSQLVNDRILTHASGYVRKVELLSRRRDKNVLYVTLRAEIVSDALDKDLEAVRGLLARLGSRKLVIVTREETIDARGLRTPSQTLATALTDAFRADGWTLVDPSFVAGKVKLEGAALGPAEVTELGQLSKADYVLYGTAVFRQQSVDGPLKSALEGSYFPVSGEYDLALFASDSGTQPAKVSGKLDMQGVKTASVSYARSAHEVARLHGPRIVDEVRKPVLEHLRSGELNGNRVVMVVQGLTDYSAVQDFKKALGVLEPVREVRPGTFGSGRAEFDVVYVGSTDALAEALGEAKFRKRKLSVVGVSANLVEVKVGK